jgi:hypothetical protein
MAEQESRVPRLEAVPEAEPTPDNERLRLGQPRSPALPPEAGGQAAPGALDLDDDRVDAIALAALLLTAHQQAKGDAWRSWKNLSWEATDRLYEKGYIGDPASKAKSVMLTEAGYDRGRALLRQLCGRDGGDD